MTTDISNWTLTGLVQRQAEAHGEREFMSFAHGTTLTFASLHRDSDRLACNLAGLGVGPGDRVMVMLKNRIEFMQVMLAIMKLGAIFVPINTELKGAFLQHQMRNAEPRVLFLDAVLAGAFDAVQGGNESLAAIVYVAGAVPDQRPAVLASATAMTFEAFASLAGAGSDVLISPKAEDIACIMYTSGTTGPSKGVLMPHAHCYLFGHNMALNMEMTEEDCQYVCMPLFHAMGLLLQVISSLISGSKVYCIERFSPNTWLNDVRTCGATVSNALGVIPEFIFRTPKTEFDRDHRLRRVVAVPIAAEWGDAMEERFGFKFIQGYGMTEINLPCYTNADDPLLPGLAGHILDDFFEVRVVNSETDISMPQGEIGEIVIRPKVPFCFNQGYFRMPEKTVEAWRNLWFHTGDAGRFDEQGRLYYADRIRDRIRRRGENISSFEIEQVLNDHPDINESAVVGVRVEGAGGEDEVKAYIVTDGGADIDNVALLDYCVEQIPRFAVPRYIEAVGALAKTATGKIQKEPLRQAGITNRTWDREAVGYKIARQTV
ncbi:MAG: AMP-binding protein [Alphaproteobacteria bacterium]|nr:AMP-binding protein [Alphaproteobacteria bacterium]